MSSPRSRSKTSGAFGNSKVRPIERDVDQPAPTKKDKPQRDSTIADKLAKFSQVILEQAGNNRTAAKGAMNVAILIWNAEIGGEEKIAEAKSKLNALPGSSPEQVDELVTMMIERKHELFPGEKSLITNFVLKFNHRTGATFNVSAVNINPEGLSKTDLSDIIKPTL